MELVKVEGAPGLRRDTQSGAIINTDRDALLAARSVKARKLAEQETIKTLEDKVERLEALLNKLLGEET